MREAIAPVSLQSRLILMLVSLERAGLSPVSFEQVHSFAYFANVMSPLWNLDPIQGAVLKRKEGPFYIELQDALDRLIGSGAVEVVSMSYAQVEGGARIAAMVRVSLPKVAPVLSALASMPDEIEAGRFIEELAFVFSEIDPGLQDDSVQVDATYSAPSSPEGRVVDFAEFKETARNFSVPAARRLQAYAPPGVTLSQAEELVLYMRLIKKRTKNVG